MDVSLATLSLFAMYIFVECFIILINLGAIKMAFDGTGTLQKISELSLVSGNVAMFITVGIGVSIVVLIYRYGFRGSVLSDKWQYIIQLIAAALFAFIAFLLADNNTSYPPLFVKGGEDWFWLGFAGIITGAFSYAQMWERFIAVPRKDALRLGLWGSFFFGIYMALVWVAGYFFIQNTFTGILLFIIIMAISTSTIDSNVAGLQFVARKIALNSQIQKALSFFSGVNEARLRMLAEKKSVFVGSVVAFLVVMSFPFIPQTDIAGIWNAMATVRWKVVVFAVGITISFQVLFWLFGWLVRKKILEDDLATMVKKHPGFGIFRVVLALLLFFCPLFFLGFL